ncbi:hypothetical protein AB9F46_35510, partial [Rhizobium leguminosarum]
MQLFEAGHGNGNRSLLEVADDVTKNNGLLNRLNSRGRKKTISGGRNIVQELQYQENSTLKRYSGYDILNVQPS